jgi:hypothetical protein
MPTQTGASTVVQIAPAAICTMAPMIGTCRRKFSSNGCEPEQIAAKATRDACDVFRKLEGELETAKAARELETKAELLRASLGQAQAIQRPNPQAAAIAGLTGLPVEDATHWYAFMASLALELAGMAAMMRAEVPTDTELPPPSMNEPLPAAASNAVAMIHPPKTGSVEQFMLACVGRAKGKRVSWAELYVRYRRWCAEQNLAAINAEQFGKRLDGLRADGLLRSRAKGEDVYCLT